MYLPPSQPDTNLERNGPGVVRDPEELHYVERILRHVVCNGTDIVKTLKKYRKRKVIYSRYQLLKGGTIIYY